MSGSLPFSSSFFWLTEHPLVNSFRWITHVTPASSPSFLVSTILSYLSVVFLLWFFMRNRGPIRGLRPVTTIHNLFLLLLSFAMAVGCTVSAFLQMPDAEWLFCFPEGTQPAGAVFFWAYVFYLSKIFEFSDTIIIVLKKKPLTFLHVYHHALVVVMCYLWLQFSQSLMVIALVTNATVHTFMYSYYLLCALGYTPRWKRMVTDCQIVQFVFSFAVSTALLWKHFAGNGGGCSGMKAWGFNAAFNGSLLILFVNFHSKNYPRGTRPEKKTA